MPRPPPGLSRAIYEAWLHATEPAVYKGGARQLPRGKPSSTRPFSHHVKPSTAPAAPRQVAANSTSHPLGRLLKSIADGVFKSVKSSSYNHPHGPYSGSRMASNAASSQAFATRRAQASIRGKVQPFTFGPAPRPALGRSTAQTLGLSSARNFSSAGQGVLANVVANAPLALRALSDELRDGHFYGIDSKRWARISRSIRSDMKRQAMDERLHRFPREKQAELVAVQRDEAFLSRCDEFKQYFAAEVAEEDSSFAEKETHVERLPVVLAIAAEPDLYLDDYDGTDSFARDPTSWRVLSPSTVSALSAITRAHEQHAHRIRALHNRLWAAGVFDPNGGAHIEADQWSPCGRRREVHIVFDPVKWDLRDVKSAVGEWHTCSSWFRIVDLQAQADHDKRTSQERSSFEGTDVELSDDGSDDVHLRVTETLILPSMNLQQDASSSVSGSTLASSLELSPPLSPYPSSSFGDVEIAMEQDDQLLGVIVDQAQREWEDARDEWQTQEPTEATLSPLADSYQDGVHEFLRSLDEMDRR